MFAVGALFKTSSLMWNEIETGGRVGTFIQLITTFAISTRFSSFIAKKHCNDIRSKQS